MTSINDDDDDSDRHGNPFLLSLEDARRSRSLMSPLHVGRMNQIAVMDGVDFTLFGASYFLWAGKSETERESKRARE